MIHSSTKLSQVNLFDCDVETSKLYTIVTTRPDLSIRSRIIVDYFGAEEQRRSTGWKYENFDYQISNLGFRDRDLPDSVDIAIFGCSFTFGQGLPEEMLWHKKLSNNLDKTVYNFGQPGLGIKAIIDLFLIMSQNVKFDSAVLLLPTFDRQSIACSFDQTNPQIIPVMPNYKSFLEVLFDVSYNDIFKILPEEELIRTLKDSLYLLDFYCKIKNIKVYVSSWDNKTYNLINEMNFKHLIVLPEWTSAYIENYQDDVARDNLHPGPIHHTVWADKITEVLQNA